jgi:hypothetical protein
MLVSIFRLHTVCSFIRDNSFTEEPVFELVCPILSKYQNASKRTLFVENF